MPLFHCALYRAATSAFPASPAPWIMQLLRKFAYATVVPMLALAPGWAWPQTTHNVYLFPSASQTLRQGFTRIINHSDSGGVVEIEAIDDAGMRYGIVTLSIDALETQHFNSDDLENGNSEKGLTGETGAGTGDWRLELSSDLDIEVLSYIRTPDGFLTAMHDVAQEGDNGLHIATFNPGSNRTQESLLRLINPGEEEVDATIRAVDDRGESPGGSVSVSIPAGVASTFSAAELESGTNGFDGLIGDGVGKWRLTVASDSPVVAMSLLESPKHLTNLSTEPSTPTDGVYRVLLFPPANDPSERQGFVRVVNRSNIAGEVSIKAHDDSARDYEPITLSIDPGNTVHFNSDDLEGGNPAKGLSAGVGAGTGDWWLEITSDLDIDLLAYIRTRDGFLTSIHDLAPKSEGRHHVPIFNPGSNTQQASRLRLVNAGEADAEVSILAWDDRGTQSGPVQLTLPVGEARSIGANEFEFGGEAFDGEFGDGAGKWRLQVESDQAVGVASLLYSVAGPITNLSTSPARQPFAPPAARCIGDSPDADGDGVLDHCDDEPQTAYRLVSGCSDGAYVESPGSNPGLVADCRILIGFANLLIQSPDVTDEHLLRRWGIGTQASIGTWDRVRISAGRVERLSLYRSGLSGPIPPELGQLSKLTSLRLESNQLSGRIPPELGQLLDLTHLDLFDNQLNGPIPRELGQLVELSWLRLSYNQLNGPIPRELGQLLNLEDLDLSVNRLNGAIPPELGKLINLESLSLGYNLLSGRIPPELGQLTNLQWLSLRGNQLSGSIPSELGQLGNLRYLYLRWNQLSGSIPPELGQLANLALLSLNNNRLSGSIPPELGQLSNLEQLELIANQFSGHIPPELGQLSKLKALNLQNLQLSGSIPPELGQLSNLAHLRLDNNQLSGPVPPELGQLADLSWLYLSQNQLSGPIPPELGQLSNLEQLDLVANQFSGHIPPELGQLSKLKALYLPNLQLSGSIPPELGQLANLVLLSLSNNQLSGSIPPELGQLANLTTLILSNNQLSGPIPPELGQLANLTYLTLLDNQLSGPVSWELLQRFSWEHLNGNQLYGNQLTGVLPAPPLAFPEDPQQNGNAAHHSLTYYQGPSRWSWNWQDSPVEHQRPIAGRGAVLAVHVNHESEQPPRVITSVRDANGNTLEERLLAATLPSTSVGDAGTRRTEYTFLLPGNLNRPGNRLVHTIDPDDEMPETDEQDNVGAAITLEGEMPPRFRVTFIPIHRPGETLSTLRQRLVGDTDYLMSVARRLLPIADDYVARVAEPIESSASDHFEAENEVHALWNADAEENEFYHGICTFCRGGVATLGGRTAVSPLEAFTVAHELGHNFGLGHAPCRAQGDPNYPYADGSIGPTGGWWFYRIIRPEDQYYDLMSYCFPAFISDYYYRQAADHWLAEAAQGSTIKVLNKAGAPSRGSLGVVPKRTPSPSEVETISESDAGIAVSGHVDEAGRWFLSHTQRTRKSPRAPKFDSDFTLILQDAAGVEMHREPVTAQPLSHGDRAVWAARVPILPRPARLLLIIDAQGGTVLSEVL